MLAFSNRKSASTGFSPFFLGHGYYFEPLEPLLETPSGSPVSPAKKGRKWVQKLKDCQDLAVATIADAQETQEKFANRLRQVSDSFRIGDKVLLRLKNVQTSRPSKKLD
jgi:hypothetical protein